MTDEVPTVPDGVLVLRIGDGTRRNALTPERKAALRLGMAAANDDPAVLAVVVTGVDDAFCAGGDLSSNRLDRSDGLDESMRGGQEVIRLIAESPKLVVAAVDGPAYGSGLALALACDLVVVGPTARLCASFVRAGLAADAGMAWALLRRLPRPAALRVLLEAAVYDAADARAAGLADVVATTGRALDAALELVPRLLVGTPESTAATKRLLDVAAAGLTDLFRVEFHEQLALVESPAFEQRRAEFMRRKLSGSPTQPSQDS